MVVIVLYSKTLEFFFVCVYDVQAGQPHPFVLRATLRLVHLRSQPCLRAALSTCSSFPPDWSCTHTLHTITPIWDTQILLRSAPWPTSRDSFIWQRNSACKCIGGIHIALYLLLLFVSSGSTKSTGCHAVLVVYHNFVLGTISRKRAFLKPSTNHKYVWHWNMVGVSLDTVCVCVCSNLKRYGPSAIHEQMAWRSVTLILFNPKHTTPIA